MGSLLIAVLFALAPEPKLSESDDFNEVVALNEAANHCTAVEVFRTEPDEIPLVRFECPQGVLILPFVLRGDDGWYPVERQWTASPKRTGTGKEI